MFRGLIVVALVLLASACADPGDSATEPDGASARLIHAFDGDSMEVEIGGRVEEIRLLGINAPEREECFGDEARLALLDLVADRDLVLVQGSTDDADRYDRLLRYVYVDGENVNETMLAEGNAVTLQSEHQHNDAFVQRGNRAAESMLGMWAPDACGPPPPPGVSIVTVEYDPPGPDDERLNDEYVTISNEEGAQTLTLAGWTLRDESSRNRYLFGSLILEPGTTVTVRTGCGEDRPGTVYWCSERPIWSNGGDTAILQDRHGNVVDRWLYTGRR